MPDLKDQTATGQEPVDDAAARQDADPQELDVEKDETQADGERAQEEAAHDRETQGGYQ